MKNTRLVITLIFSLLNYVERIGQNTIVLTQNAHKYDFHFDDISVFEDPTNRLTFNEIIQKKFIKTSKKTLNSGYSNSKFWYKINLKIGPLAVKFFNISGTIVDQIEFYEVLPNNKIKKRVSGAFYPFSQR